MNDKLSLTELQLVIRDSLYLALPSHYWVIAEISEIKENYAGHCYLELIEKQPDDTNVRARARGIIWSKRYRFLKPLFENVTGETLREGKKVLLKVKIEYHEVYGLSLVINDLDPAFTLGEMALRRQQIIKRLEEEGVISMNRELEFPVLPKRLAIISSRNAAGYSDFMKHLSGNSYKYHFNTALFEAVMQGTGTEKSIIDALERISQNIELFDVVIIIRGGGSQTDLSWFDNYNIAYYITQFPLPVITGIGHEKDLSVSDMVAYRAEKTPTAAADFLINCMISTEEHLLDIGKEISSLAQIVVTESRNILDMHRMRLIPVARMMLSQVKEKLSYNIMNIVKTGKDYVHSMEIRPKNQVSRLESAIKSYSAAVDSNLNTKLSSIRGGAHNLIRNQEVKIESFMTNLLFLDPEQVLKRGYSITTVRGKAIKSTEMVNNDDEILTRLSDGIIESKVIRKK